VVAKSGQFTASETGKASSSEETKGIWQKRKLYEKDFVSRSYSGYALSLLGKGECCSGFGKRVCQFITRKSKVTEDSLET